MTITLERRVALLATVLGVLAGYLMLCATGGTGDSLGAGVIAYAATAIGLAVKLRLQLRTIITSTGRGALITAVLMVLLLTSIGRAFAEVRL